MLSLRFSTLFMMLASATALAIALNPAGNVAYSPNLAMITASEP